MDTKPVHPEPSPMLHCNRSPDCGRTALVLQGGGALGAYQAGVYEAMHEAGLEPDWVSGVSIGAVNAALIAGNKVEHRLEALRIFWHRITDRTIWPYTPDGDVFRTARNNVSAFTTSLFGQPNMFAPHPVNPWMLPAGAKNATSFYDNAPLRETLSELIDVKLLNAPERRFSVGAVNVLTGNFRYFDNATDRIGLSHIMASGALPPAFPMVEIGTEYFWDGGIVSNTPLAHLLEQKDGVNSLVFQVDLFSARGALPRTIMDVIERHKDIIYSSRTRQVTDLFALVQQWKTNTYEALCKVPEEALTDEERNMRDSLAALPLITILQIIYQKKSYEGSARDYEFSPDSMAEHWKNGYDDTRQTLQHKAWLAMPPKKLGIVTHDVHRNFEG